MSRGERKRKRREKKKRGEGGGRGGSSRVISLHRKRGKRKGSGRGRGGGGGRRGGPAISYSFLLLRKGGQKGRGEEDWRSFLLFGSQNQKKVGRCLLSIPYTFPPLRRGGKALREENRTVASPI